MVVSVLENTTKHGAMDLVPITLLKKRQYENIKSLTKNEKEFLILIRRLERLKEIAMEKNNNKLKLRFPGFTEPWEQRKLGEISERITRKNTELESTLPLTISAQYGLVDQITFFNNRVASRDVSGYYLLKKGEFAYNKSYSEGYPWGAVKRLERYENGVLSTLYICFKLSDVNSNFLVSYYDTNKWYKEVSQRAAEGARNHGLLNISADDFFDTKLTIPKSKEEQDAIGCFFQDLDKLITLHQRKLNHLQDKKKSLLQKMFPKNGEDFPELRFPEFNDPWEQRKFHEEVEFYSGLTYSPNDVGDNGTFVLRSSNVKNGEIVDADNVYVNSEVVNSSNVKEGDIIVVVRNGSRSLIGKHAQVKKRMDKTVIGAFMTGIRSNQSSFINALMDTQQFSGEIEKNLGATINQITNGMFREMKFKFPDVQEQNQIGNFFNNLDNLIALNQCKLNHLQEQKKALLQQMFV